MKKQTRLISTIVLVFALMLLSTAVIEAQFAGGEGTEERPYRVDNAQHLNNVRHYLTSHFIQTSDIDLSDPEWTEEEGWVPLGVSRAESFDGVYDGDGYVINNLTINRSLNFQGLFGVTQGGTIKRVSVLNANVTGASAVGAIIGAAEHSTLTIDCYGEGIITGTLGVGGLIGESVSGSSIVGCFSEGTVISTTLSSSYIGGITGYNIGEEVANCFSSMTIIGEGSYVGGLIGLQSSENIINCYFKGRINPDDPDNNHGFGLLGGYNNGDIVDCYWDVTRSNRLSSPGGGEGRTTQQMTHPHSVNTYVRWDFTNVWVEDFEGDVNEGYPFLQWQIGETNPNPNIASNPQPNDEATEVPLDLENIGWSYHQNPQFATPLGFRVYMNQTGEFSDTDPFVWVEYQSEQQNYLSSEIIPAELEPETVYYWKVVPTTIDPYEGRRDAAIKRERNAVIYNRGSGSQYRGDAQNVPVWSFTTEREIIAYQLTIAVEGYGATEPEAGFEYYYEENSEVTIEAITTVERWIFDRWEIVTGEQEPEIIEELITVVTMTDNIIATAYFTEWFNPYPTIATNPVPEDRAAGISVDISEFRWDYIEDIDYTNPVGFRVYVGTDEDFGEMHFWVPYVDEELTFIIELPQEHIELSPETTYYWKVVPTTIYPDNEVLSGDLDVRNRHESANIRRQTIAVRGDAQDVPLWSFTTAALQIEEENLLSPFVTKLTGNYPNPFNPQTKISFTIADAGEVAIKIYNLNGQRVFTMSNIYPEAGSYKMVWDGKDRNNNQLGSGMYLYEMKKGNFSSTGKMILLK